MRQSSVMSQPKKRRRCLSPDIVLSEEDSVHSVQECLPVFPAINEASNDSFRTEIDLNVDSQSNLNDSFQETVHQSDCHGPELSFQSSISEVENISFQTEHLHADENTADVDTPSKLYRHLEVLDSDCESAKKADVSLVHKHVFIDECTEDVFTPSKFHRHLKQGAESVSQSENRSPKSKPSVVTKLSFTKDVKESVGQEKDCGNLSDISQTIKELQSLEASNFMDFERSFLSSVNSCDQEQRERCDTQDSPFAVPQNIRVFSTPTKTPTDQHAPTENDCFITSTPLVDAVFAMSDSDEEKLSLASDDTSSGKSDQISESDFEHDECGSNLEDDFDLVYEDIAGLASSEVGVNSSVSASFEEDEISDRFAKAYPLNEIKIHPLLRLTINESILQIMKLFMKNRQSKSGLKRIIKLIMNFIPENHLLPKSSYFFLKYISDLAPPASFTTHYYCKQCLLYCGGNAGPCEICGEEQKEFGRFFSFDTSTIIRYFFEQRNLAAIIDAYPNTADSSARDVRNGTVYKNLNAHRNKYDLNLLANSDGAKVRDSSKKELWLLLSTILEIPPRDRNSFMMVLGVWYGSEKPVMNTFLKPFSESVSSLHTNGVAWKHPVSGEIITSTVKVPSWSADAPARAKLQNIMLYNSVNGCNLCEICTVRTAPVPGKKRIRVYPYEPNSQLRTQERMTDQALQVTNSVDHKPVMGVKGPSVLSVIPSVDISQCFIPEVMHSALLGVVKRLLSTWVSKPGPWSIKKKIDEIDNFLSNLKHPDFVHRPQRALKHLTYFKASDFYYFLLFESLPCLLSHLPEEYFQHYMLLVYGLFTLMKTSITDEEIDEADRMLKLFVSQYSRLYGDQDMTYNLHQLCHLGLSVRRHGSLMFTSAFPFEDMNGLIVNATHGFNEVDKEIINNISICQGIHVLETIVDGVNSSDPRNINFCHGQVLGEECLVDINQEEIQSFPNHTAIKIFSRAKIGYDVYSSEIHKKLKSENFYVIWNEEENTRLYSIKYFAVCDENLYVCLRELKVDHLHVFYHAQTVKAIAHLIPFVSTQNFTVSKVDALVLSSLEKVGRISNFLFRRPNLYRLKL